MTTLLRHLLAVLLLPFVVVVVVPWWLPRSPFVTGLDTRWESGASATWLPSLLGVLLSLCGLALFAWCLSLFIRVGRGTLAPWDPTSNLVAVGPYRHVRNPMISGVLVMLIGEALFLQSFAIALWALAFFAANHVYFLLSEEPGLERRFGNSYRSYKAHVPRWLPRLTPW
jgi:protein-S-isoprenylcysteine O-methyltransferase Ste14